MNGRGACKAPGQTSRKGSAGMRVGTEAGMESAGIKNAGKRRAARGAGRLFDNRNYANVMEDGNAAWMTNSSRLQQMDGKDGKEQDSENGEVDAGREVRSEAEKIYQAATAGKENPIKQLRQAPKVPYEHLAVDGVINYNGVCFVCDAESNSICLGDMTDKENVLTITLSGGGHLKVNRNNIGDLSKAAGMFSPEDLNLIMRAVALDTKIQSMKKEIEDTEASVGNQISVGREGTGTEVSGTESAKERETA